ncbi:acidic leucine-rich nuclear phosphoprotein 32-related protein-like [Olea europaea var. sylvestris]|uniref:acidic leucine-rich nuclear phosphoprotein 32-related protein-like n=1 Tax=Olea europaea var. sylvestris TaxID=158386 RepID=UPI000C1D12C1|nr:acidic leucine-rich nuclear phosphoprotein 32-related protein-like [Olea europaea var. sylvestris]
MKPAKNYGAVLHQASQPPQLLWGPLMIARGLEFLVEAGLEFLQDLDLSNNRISDVNDLKSLAELRLVSLDLYECPVTWVKDYRSRAFELISSLKYLDKIDAEGNERLESDDEVEDTEENQRLESDDEDEDAEWEWVRGGWVGWERRRLLLFFNF